MRRRVTVAVIALALSGLMAPPAGAELKLFAEAFSQGNYAGAKAAGTAKGKPKKIVLKVHASPDQKVTVEWTMKCFKGDKVRSKKGSFSADTPIRRGLGMTFDRPRKCKVSAATELPNGESLHIALYKKV